MLNSCWAIQDIVELSIPSLVDFWISRWFIEWCSSRFRISGPIPSETECHRETFSLPFYPPDIRILFYRLPENSEAKPPNLTVRSLILYSRHHCHEFIEYLEGRMLPRQQLAPIENFVTCLQQGCDRRIDAALNTLHDIARTSRATTKPVGINADPGIRGSV